MAKISREYVVGIEAGQRNPSLDVAYQLATAFGMSLGELFQGL